MPRKIPIFYSALLLTGVNLLLRLAGTSFQVYLSASIGAAGIGLLQLTMSVGGLAMVAGMGGIRTAAMYLTAEEIGRRREGNVRHVLSACFLYSLLVSGTVSAAVYGFAPRIAADWIGDSRTVPSLQLFAAFLPVTCLCGVMTGYFTAAGRIGTLAAVEVGEQICSMGITLAALSLWAGSDPGRCCLAVVLGSSLGACLTLLCLTLLRLREHAPGSPRIPVAQRLLGAAVPLALADNLKAGINTAENLMVPKRLALHAATAEPLAAFGLVSGMVFPVIMFPAAILFGLNELLIPELARCNAAGSGKRIHHLVTRSLRVSLIYGLLCGGLLYLLADWLCIRLYGSSEASRFMALYALLVPMLYCDCVTDAMTKGLGQQTVCVRYNIITSVMDVCFLFLLLPRWGMEGYFVSFLVTHLVNFWLSLRRLLKITNLRIPFHTPVLAVSAMLFALLASSLLGNVGMKAVAYCLLLLSGLTLSGILNREDRRWLMGLIRKQDPSGADTSPAVSSHKA